MKTTTRKEARRPDYGAELAAVLDRIAREEEALKEETKERKGRIAKLVKRARQLCDIIAGRDLEQLPVPGTETSAAADALAEAHAAARRETCGACGKPAALPSPGCEECDHGT